MSVPATGPGASLVPSSAGHVQGAGALTFVNEARRGLQRATVHALRSLPLVRSMRPLRSYPWCAERIVRHGQREREAVLDGASFGLSMCLAVASKFLDIPLPTTLAATCEVDSCGNTAPDQDHGLEAKVDVLAGEALGVTRLLSTHRNATRRNASRSPYAATSSASVYDRLAGSGPPCVSRSHGAHIVLVGGRQRRAQERQRTVPCGRRRARHHPRMESCRRCGGSDSCQFWKATRAPTCAPASRALSRDGTAARSLPSTGPTTPGSARSDALFAGGARGQRRAERDRQRVGAHGGAGGSSPRRGSSRGGRAS